MKPESATRTPWTYSQYAAIPADGRRHEIVDGDHYVNPAPSLYHQQVSRHIQFQLYTAIETPELGVVINAPVDVQLTDHDIVQPDLVVITKPNFHIMTPTKVRGVPDLLVEILSPSNAKYDLETKRQAYQRCGVPEYWIVSPDEHQVLQLVMREGTYGETVARDSITMAVAPHVQVDLRRVW